MKHDAFRQVAYIQEALSQNKKALGVFIGAGCPLSIRVNIEEDEETGEFKSDPLIPDVAGLTKKVTSQLSSGEKENPNAYDKLISQIKKDGIENPNIEDILSQIRALKQVVGTGKVRSFELEDLEALDSDICSLISEYVFKELPTKDSPYHNLAVWMRSIPRDKAVHLFTTNYDLLIEQALEESSCPYFDGFIGSRKAFFDIRTVEEESLLNARWSRLWKIHGSINWKLNQDGEVIRSTDIDEDDNHLIYPSHLKYNQSRKMPYLAMLDRLKDFFNKQGAILCICGYSFSDDHINDIIVQGLQSNPTSMVFAFLYEELSSERYEDARKCAQRTPNLSLMAFDEAIIGRQQGCWHINDDEKLQDIPARVVRKEEDDEIESYYMKLGDFSKFGEFLGELSSNQNSSDNEGEKKEE
ncbi:SIR2 family NAD-dependent protein deacylase [Fodinibius saliphilus]|uniref:SIR2 family NAD-dependent protein deacylase n=1 Tax=Fodinibius saliphilus TaxID=1920650 RepID=UPI00110807E5|nr:SIR2 family protein [Fodinibius saliphilus]